MQTTVQGQVIDVETRDYVGSDGQKKTTFDAYLAATNPRYAPTRVSGPAELTPNVGAVVQYVVTVTAKVSRSGKAWLSVWALSGQTLQQA